MFSILAKRFPRELKANFLRYLSLFLMLLVGIYFISAFAISYDSMEVLTKQTAREHNLEDGSFTTFLPLTDEQVEEVRDLGVTLERKFYFDVECKDDTTVRVMRVRKGINTIAVTSGRLPEKNNEILLEKCFARENNYTPGSKINIGRKEFTVVGTGVVPDYNSTLKNLTDTSPDTEKFGLGFVNDASFNSLSQRFTTSYEYSFLLNGVKYDDLKSTLANLSYDYKNIKDPLFLDMLQKATEDQQKLLSAIRELNNGITKYREGMKTMNDGANTLKGYVGSLSSAVQTLHAASATVEKGISAAGGSIDQLKTSVGQLKRAADTFRDGMETLSQEAGKLVDLSLTVEEIVNLSKESTLETESESLNTQLGRTDIKLEQATYQSQLEALMQEYSGEPEKVAAIQESKEKIELTFAGLDYILKEAGGLGQLGDAIKTAYDYSVQLSSGVDKLNAAVQSQDFSMDALQSYVAACDTVFIALVGDGAGTPSMLDGLNTLLDGISKSYEGSQKLEEATTQLLNEVQTALDKAVNNTVSLVTSFVKQADNPRIMGSYRTAVASKSIILAFGAIFLILMSYVFSIFVGYQINKEVKTIGALYSMGVTKWQVMMHYLILPTIITVAGTLAGFLLALTPIRFVNAYTMLENSNSVVDYHMIILPYLVLCCIAVPFVLCVGINILSLNKQLSRHAIDLLKDVDEAKVNAKKGMVLRFPKNMGFIRMFQIRQMFREKKAAVTIIFGLLAGILIIMLGLSLQCTTTSALQAAKTEPRFNYMYIIKYPDRETLDLAHLNGAEEYCMKPLTNTVLGKSASINIYGVNEDQTYFPAHPEKGYNKLSVGKSLAEKYSLKIGSRLVLSDPAEEQDYVFYVTEICDYNVGLSAFMDMESMRKLFRYDERYYNVLLSKNPLKMIEKGRVLGTITKDEIITAAQMKVSQTEPLVYLDIIVSSVILLLVLYILSSTMIERCKTGISLNRIFGFTEKELKQMYINYNLFVVGFGAAIAIPISVFLSREIIGAVFLSYSMGLNIFMPWWGYLIFFAAVMIAYYVISLFLQLKLRSISLTEALKSRG